MTDRNTLEDELVALVPDLRGFARGLARNYDTADDLVQETITKAWANLGKFQHGTNMRAWLFTILRNTFYSQMRKRRWETEDVDEKLAGKLTQPQHQDAGLHMKDFWNQFMTLSPDQREALVLVGASGFSYEEAAEIANVAVGTIKSRVNRGRQRLYELMGEDAASVGVANMEPAASSL